MTEAFRSHLQTTLAAISEAGLHKRERILTTSQRAHVAIRDDSSRNLPPHPMPAGGVLNFCANNYLGLADHPEIIRAAHAALDRWGYGLSSVRFICGTQEIHRELEAKLSTFLGTEATILYSSCFDANGGVFETLLSAEDAVISDELNHASIIDGIRLSKAQRFRYNNCDLADLEAKLREADAAKARFKLVVTDGVFSMDGFIAPLREICELARKYGALVMVDDSHAVGFMGHTGRGTHEHAGVMNQVDLLSGTLGKALGGASGGYVSGRKEIVDLLRQRSRPYLFSNTLAPVITAGSIAALDLIQATGERRDALMANAAFFRRSLTDAGFQIKPGIHPIVPVMLGDARVAQEFAVRMLEKGVLVVGFFHPVVPHGTARIRIQVSAAHSQDDLEFAIRAFADVKRDLAL